MKFILNLIGMLAAFFSIAAGIKSFWDIPIAYIKYGLVFIGMCGFIYLFFFLFQEREKLRKIRYIEGIEPLNRAFQVCIQGAKAEFKTTNEMSVYFTKFCDHLADAFKELVGSECAVCIKVINDTFENNKERSSVSTLCRDSRSHWKRRYNESEVISFIDKNTDFYEMASTINKPFGGTYFSKNLALEKNYENTSLHLHPIEAKKFFEIRSKNIKILRRYRLKKIWPLPYLSAIGSAIYSMNGSDSGSNYDMRSGKNLDLAGYLFVDNPNVNSFYKKYDEKIVRYMADAVYPLLVKWHNLIIAGGGDKNA